MRYLILPLVLLAALSLHGQQSYTVSMNEGYTDDVFFSLDEGTATTVDASSWHLAFEVTGPFSIGVRVNDGHSTVVKSYPSDDISAWGSVDTSGFSTWPALTNGITAWADGALNQSASGDPSDFSWGVYSGPPTHTVVGDSLYIVKTMDGSAFQLRLDVLDNGVWNFTQADIDGSNEVPVTITMEDYFGRNLVYYNLNTQEVLNREPLASDWDFVFTRYVGMTMYGMFPTSGVLLNTDRFVAQADDVDVATADFNNYTLTNDDISVIGNDWKELVDFAWQIVPDQCFFVQAASGDIYKVIFTAFEGSGTGNISFTTELVSSASITAEQLTDVNLYPNPAESSASVRLEAPSQDLLIVEMRGSNGQLIDQVNVAAMQTAGGLILSAPSLPGVYFVRMQYADRALVRKLVVR